MRILVQPNFAHFAHLDLSRNGIGDDGCMLIAEWMATMQTTLLYLNLCDNNIGDKGASMIAEKLQVNDTLLVFDISQNERMTDTSARAMSYMCQINASLEEVKFLSYALDVQSLTVMRLLYRYGVCETPKYQDKA